MIRADFAEPRPVDLTAPGPGAGIGAGIRVLVLTVAEGPAREALAGRLRATGAEVETADEIYSALSEMMEDPCDHDLFVMECDGFGGLEAGRRAAALLGRMQHPVPVILVTGDCAEQHFPDDWREAAVLRAPVSAVSLRVGMEQVLRHRLGWLHDPALMA